MKRIGTPQNTKKVGKTKMSDGKWLLFVAPFNRKKDIGLYRKTCCQSAVFGRLLDGCVLMCFTDDAIVSEKYENGVKTGERISRIDRKWAFHSRIKTLQFAVGAELSHNKYEYLYFRDILITKVMKDVIRKCRRTDTKIIMEIPTYPYYYETFKGESSLIKGAIQAAERMVGDRHYYKHCDLIPVVKCVSDAKLKPNMFEMYNCVNEDLPVVSHRKKDYIDIMGVGHIHHYHGYDRLIRGFASYYAKGGQEDIRLHIIGNGDELQKLKKLSAECGTEDRVFFEGVKTGEELAEFYRNTDLALGTLCLFKRGADTETAIKLSEALYQGIPVMTSGKVPMDFVGKDMIYTVPNDESDIDADKLLEFIKNRNYDADYTQMREKLQWESLLGKMLDDERLKNEE